jgi:chemotaxis signal transduction protein
MSNGEDAFLKELQEEFLMDPESHLRTMQEAFARLKDNPLTAILAVMKVSHMIPPLAEPIGFKFLAELVREFEVILRDLESAYVRLGQKYQEDDTKVLEFFLGDAIRNIESYYADLRREGRDHEERANERRPAMRVLAHWRPAGTETSLGESEGEVIEGPLTEAWLEDALSVPPIQSAAESAFAAPVSGEAQLEKNELFEDAPLVSSVPPVLESVAINHQNELNEHLETAPQLVLVSTPPEAVVDHAEAKSSELGSNRPNLSVVAPSFDGVGPHVDVGAAAAAGVHLQYLMCRASAPGLSGSTQLRAFAIPVRQILEVIDHQVVNPLPYSRPGISGMLNFRGDPLPILVCDDHGGDAAALKWQRKGYIVIARIGEKTFGFQMEQVLSVSHLDPKLFQKPEGVLGNEESSWVTHLVRTEGDVIMIMDLNRAMVA